MALSVVGQRVFFPRSFRLYQQIRKGYIVLLPEVNPEQLEQNPLYKNGLPDVENLSTDKCINTLGRYIIDFEHCVREVEDRIIVPNKEDPLDVFEDVVDKLEEATAKLETTWGLMKALYLADNQLMPRDSYISCHERARRARSLKYTSRHLYNSFKGCDSTKLTEEEQRVVSKFLIEGRLNGLDLGAEGSELFVATSRMIGQEKQNFEKKVKISSSKFSHDIIDASITREFPEDLLKALSVNKSGDECAGPWRVTLAHHDQFLQYCPQRSLRWNVWLNQRQVASALSGSETFSSSTLERIRCLRRDLAKLLGYKSFAHMSMETKMAGSLGKVQKTLNLLLEKARVEQGKEITALQNFAEDRGFEGRLELWDVPYWERKQKVELFNWDETKIREYFPFEKVLSGLLETCSELFSLRFQRADVRAWHKDVLFFYIYEQESTRPIAGLYLDPYAREGKLEHGGQLVCLRPSARVLGPALPLAALLFNFQPPSKRPSLLHFSQVDTLFMKFGQSLQQLLSTANYIEVSGLSNIEWDAVDVVSNVMSLFLNDESVLKKISGHYKTGEELPLVSLADVRRHLSGYHWSEEIYKANLDLQLHTTKDFWLQVVRRLWPEHFVFDLDPKDSHPLSFLPSISGAYSAAYFSRIWAWMLAHDVYSTFQSDPDKKAVGSRFRDTLLCFGGGCHPNEVLRRFQGRDPSPEMLLHSIGNTPQPELSPGTPPPLKHQT